MTDTGSPVVRPARADDLDAVVAIQHSEPTPELIGLAGSPERARRFGRALVRSEGILVPTRPVVLIEDANRPVAFMAYSIGPTESGSTHPDSGHSGHRRTWSQRRAASACRLAVRRAVHLVVPQHSLYIAELHVDPDHRGEGLGSQLLAWSSLRCRESGARSTKSDHWNREPRHPSLHEARIRDHRDSDRTRHTNESSARPAVC